MKKTRKNRREASGAVCDDRCAAVVLEQGRDDALRNVGVDFRRALGIIEGRVEPPTSRLQTEELAHSILPDPRTYNLLAFREPIFGYYQHLVVPKSHCHYCLDCKEIVINFAWSCHHISSL